MSTYRFGTKELDEMLRCGAQVRYEYFVKRVADWDEVWSLRNNDGWVMLATDAGVEVAPFWPFSEFAAFAATGLWADTQPARISLSDFIERWLPGLERDGRQVSVFPTADDKGAVVSPGVLLADINAALDEIE